MNRQIEVLIERIRGTLTPDRSLADLTWLRVGGPADEADLDCKAPVFRQGKS